MTRYIHKYKIPTDGCDVPAGKVVHVGYQGQSDELPIAWIEYSGDEGDATMRLSFYGTAEVIGDGVHVGSAVCGRFVWHVHQS